MSEPVSEFTISLDQVKDYQFQVHFPKEELDDLVLDEGPPLGAYAGPSPSMFLASAIGGCLSSSLLFCARKQRVEVGRLRARVTVQTVRNEDRRLRIGKVEVQIEPDIAGEDQERARRCVELFEQFCTVTESIRGGIPVEVHVAGYK